jgi:hypothetical protein
MALIKDLMEILLKMGFLMAPHQRSRGNFIKMGFSHGPPSGHQIFCPVIACANVVHDMQRDGNRSTDFIHCFLQENGTFADLHSKTALTMLRQSLHMVDSESLNINADNCGLHSLWPSAVMAMYFNGIPVYTIMLLRRWWSDAFLHYIRKHVTEFSRRVSRKMIQHPAYYHISHAQHDDPHMHNRLSTAANSGMGNHGNDASGVPLKFGNNVDDPRQTDMTAIQTWQGVTAS